MIDIVARALLFPLLLAQAQRVRAGTEPLPEPPGPRSAREGGGEQTRPPSALRDRGPGAAEPGAAAGLPSREAPGKSLPGRPGALRLLVVGDSSAVGVGAPHQDVALARPLARQLAQRLDRAVRWTLLAQTGLTSASALAYLKAREVPEADVAIVVVGVNDITNQVPIAQALKHRGEIALWLEAHAEVGQVLFPALPEMELFPSLPQPLAWWAGQMARRNNRAQARWARNWPLARPRVAHVPMEGVMQPELMASDGFHPGPGLYARVAEHLAEVIARDVLAPQPLSEEKT
jgi:lysophospholipase L1-like esterase